MTEEEVILNEANKVEEENTVVEVSAGGVGDRRASNYVASTPTNYATSKRGIVVLGLYLVLTLLISVFLLFSLMTARDTGKPKPEDKSETAENGNTNTNGNNSQNAASAANVNANNANQNANVNANFNNANGGNINTNNKNGKQPSNGGNGNSPVGNAGKTPTPSPTPALKQTFYKNDIPPNVSARFFGDITADSFIFLVVVFAGMLGASVRAIHSFFQHLGLGDFSFKWTWYYLLLPYSGAALSVVIYLVIRGGFYTSSYGEGLLLNIFSFAALAALTGLFSDNAMEKLRQVASVLLADITPKIPNAKEFMDKKNKTK